MNVFVFVLASMAALNARELHIGKIDCKIIQQSRMGYHKSTDKIVFRYTDANPVMVWYSFSTKETLYTPGDGKSYTQTTILGWLTIDDIYRDGIMLSDGMNVELQAKSLKPERDTPIYDGPIAHSKFRLYSHVPAFNPSKIFTRQSELTELQDIMQNRIALYHKLLSITLGGNSITELRHSIKPEPPPLLPPTDDDSITTTVYETLWLTTYEAVIYDRLSFIVFAKMVFSNKLPRPIVDTLLSISDQMITNIRGKVARKAVVITTDTIVNKRWYQLEMDLARYRMRYSAGHMQVKHINEAKLNIITRDGIMHDKYTTDDSIDDMFNAMYEKKLKPDTKEATTQRSKRVSIDPAIWTGESKDEDKYIPVLLPSSPSAEPKPQLPMRHYISGPFEDIMCRKLKGRYFVYMGIAYTPLYNIETVLIDGLYSRWLQLYILRGCSNISTELHGESKAPSVIRQPLAKKPLTALARRKAMAKEVSKVGASKLLMDQLALVTVPQIVKLHKQHPETDDEHFKCGDYDIETTLQFMPGCMRSMIATEGKGHAYQIRTQLMAFLLRGGIHPQRVIEIMNMSRGASTSDRSGDVRSMYKRGGHLQFNMSCYSIFSLGHCKPYMPLPVPKVGPIEPFDIDTTPYPNSGYARSDCARSLGCPGAMFQSPMDLMAQIKKRRHLSIGMDSPSAPRGSDGISMLTSLPAPTERTVVIVPNDISESAAVFLGDI